jgi:hypothetical protein
VETGPGHSEEGADERLLAGRAAIERDAFGEALALLSAVDLDAITAFFAPDAVYDMSPMGMGRPPACDSGHIPGAVFWNAYSDLRDADYRPIRHTQLESLLSRSGPAGEAIRLAGAPADAMRAQVESALRDALSPYTTADGVVLGASTWIVTARVR